MISAHTDPHSNLFDFMETLSKILACTDGSLYATSVYRHAHWAASRLKARIDVLHIIDSREESVPHVDLSGTIGLNARQRLREELVALDEARGRAAQAKASLILEEAKAYFAKVGLDEVKFESRHGSLVEMIENKEAQASLVVIGKRGEAADFAKLHLGANLERVIRSCHHPVLVAARSFQPVNSMLIAFDGGPSAQKAVRYAASQPLLKGLKCILMAVGKPCATIQNDLSKAAETLKSAGYDVDARMEQGEPEKVFAETIQSESIQLLVMGAYGHSRIRQLIVGSTTTTMVRTCRVPVLLFR